MTGISDEAANRTISPQCGFRTKGLMSRAYLNAELFSPNSFKLRVLNWQAVLQGHDRARIKLQAHGDKSEPISFRNIWVRELK